MKALSILVAAAIFLSLATPVKALTISNVVLTPLEDGVTASWTTDEPADGEIDISTGTFGIGESHQVLLTEHQLTAHDDLHFLPEITYPVNIYSKNASGEKVSTGPLPFTTLPDTTPPVISNVTIDSVGSHSTVIHVVANEWEGSAFVDYGLTQSYGETIKGQLFKQDQNERHYRAILNNLSPFTKYYLRIRADDGYGNNAQPVENLTITTDKLWSQNSFQSQPVLYRNICVIATEASGCNSYYNYIWPKEMSWTGNELLIYFNATQEDLNRGDLKFAVNVTYVAQDEGEWVELEVAGGNNPANLSIIEPGIVINQAKKYSITFSPVVFSPGLNYLRLRGTTIDSSEIGAGNVAPVAVWNKMELLFPTAPLTDPELLDKTEAQAARYFWDRTLSNGFVRNGEFSLDSSITATGFGLTSLAVMANRYGTSNEWSITPAQAQARALQILNNAVNYQGLQTGNPALYGKAGFLYHFVNENGQRSGESEVSTVDMALFTAGALTAGQYFGGEVQTKANQLFNHIDWSYFQDSQNKLFYLGWKPEQVPDFEIPAPDGGYLSSKRNDNNEIIPGQWDQPTDEVIIINLLALASNPTNTNFRKSLYAWPRVTRSYAGYNVVNSYFGSLFTYLFGPVFFNYKAMGFDDPTSAGMSTQSVNWFINSKNAALANRQFVIDQSGSCSTFSENQWGLSASYAPDNTTYLATSGAKPATANNGEPYYNHCVIPPYAAIGTMPLLRSKINEPLSSNLAFAALRNYYDNHFNGLWGTYGPHDSLWTPVSGSTVYSDIYLGINKGVEVLMIENYRTGLINKYFMSHPEVRQAVLLQFPNTDIDDDGFPDKIEDYIGTDSTKACPITETANDELVDPWPPDINDNGIVQIDDIFFASSRFNIGVGSADYLARAEIVSQNGIIGIDDIFGFSSRFNQICTAGSDSSSFNIAGEVIDSQTKKHIQNLTVTLTSPEDPQATQTYTGDNLYYFLNPPTKILKIEVSAPGYKKEIKHIKPEPDPKSIILNFELRNK